MAAGRMVILVDEEDRENEGDLVLAAEHVTPQAINFMARFGRGLICLTMTRERWTQVLELECVEFAADLSDAVSPVICVTGFARLIE